MKIRALILIGFLFSLSPSYSQVKPTIAEIREELFYTDFDLEKCYAFYNKLAVLQQETPTIAAYEAAAKALVAKHSWNPITKINSIREAMKMLTSAVDLDKTNLEIRFLRLYIENSLPEYLGMKDNLEEDKQVILKNIQWLDTSDLNADIIKYILNYMSSAVTCTSEEIKIIQARLL
ncbi:hypothetical protein [Fulvivirga lutea]|uniref:Uncharacterized protein n=1 Tax=Fulvivirga lutea TaxID=2810512 RepID=A0A975A0X3_9BACT|nr:hypothetical protein [Fulvivirga lutea]QSE97824.1 hypothetical protein JR347_01675 [Fulvivirga lutea]